MWNHRCVVVVFFLVTFIHEYKSESVSHGKLDSVNRSKRQDDRCFWRHKTSTPKDDPANQVTTPSDNPCHRPPLKKPDFRKPWRRISEIKCYEYIWEIKFREEKAKDEKECEEYRKTHPEEIFLGVIGGKDALPGEYPHMAAIGWKAAVGTWIFKCGGSLISHWFVLTAAHCTRVSTLDTTVAEFKPKMVRMGDKNIIDVYANNLYPYDVEIKNIISHPKYKSPKKYFDIALLELKEYVEFFENVQPACLWTKFDTSPLGTKATVTGWGVIESAGRTMSPTLQTGEVDLIDSQTCDSLLRPSCNRLWCGIRNDQICAGRLEGGVDACQGDSGGPIQVRINLPPTAQGAMHFVFGVTSFGFGCALPDTPGVYTRVSSYIDWIEPIVFSNDEV